jgi:hypothetical protein
MAFMTTQCFVEKHAECSGIINNDLDLDNNVWPCGCSCHTSVEHERESHKRAHPSSPDVRE